MTNFGVVNRQDNKLYINTHITMAEFFIILPHGPKCCMGLGAFRDLVLLETTKDNIWLLSPKQLRLAALNHVMRHIKILFRG